MTNSGGTTRARNWGFEMGYWLADGEPDPDVPFPKDWEVCGWPSLDPFSLANNDKRHGQTCIAWPRYAVREPISELDATCSFLEKMTLDALATWLSLQDRYIYISCGDPEMDPFRYEHSRILASIGPDPSHASPPDTPSCKLSSARGNPH
jgi:hypothetical protein